MIFKIFVFDIIQEMGYVCSLEELHLYVNQDRYKIIITINRKEIEKMKEIFMTMNMNEEWKTYLELNMRGEQFDEVQDKDLNDFNFIRNRVKNTHYTTIKDMLYLQFYNVQYENNSNLSRTEIDYNLYFNRKELTLISKGFDFTIENTLDITVNNLVVHKVDIFMNYRTFILITDENNNLFKDQDLDLTLFSVANIKVSTILTLQSVLIEIKKSLDRGRNYFYRLTDELNKYQHYILYRSVRKYTSLITILLYHLSITDNFMYQSIRIYESLFKYNFIYPNKYFKKTDKFTKTLFDMTNYVLNKFGKDSNFAILKEGYTLHQIKDVWKRFFPNIQEKKLIDSFYIDSNYYKGIQDMISLDKNILDDPCKCKNETYCDNNICWRGCFSAESLWDKPFCYVKDKNKCRRSIISDAFKNEKWVVCDINQYKKNSNILLDKYSLQMFQQIVKHTQKYIDFLQNLRDRLLEMKRATYENIEFYNSKNMSLLTIVATVFLPITFIAGWYGMNFTTMYELNFPNAYKVTILFNLIIVVGLLWYFYEDLINLSPDTTNIDIRRTIYRYRFIDDNNDLL